MKTLPAVVLAVTLLWGCGNSGDGNDAGLDGTDSDATHAGDDGKAADAADPGELPCELSAEPGGLEDCGFDPSLPFDHLAGTVLQLRSADGEFCARLERRDDSPFPDGSATLWTLLAARIGRTGSVTLVDDPDSLCWRVSHHNWEDAARVWSGTNRYDIELTTLGGHAGNPVYTLKVFQNGPLDPEDTYCLREGSNLLCPPIELFPFDP